MLVVEERDSRMVSKKSGYMFGRCVELTDGDIELGALKDYTFLRPYSEIMVRSPFKRFVVSSLES